MVEIRANDTDDSVPNADFAPYMFVDIFPQHVPAGSSALPVLTYRRHSATSNLH
ncbi:hypothetical protein F441_08379 [Phytophthora nicotianae CJ01A1]|uniref:Uncharacterized protein n=1 Tax=Phytophthora nicotianae CJ01A1 TaxID=1317063 RepID=W2X470_PHYNI|nr:hypothetical protein F441_08379 [Phytophthora nicotianae CJ01A1]